MAEELNAKVLSSFYGYMNLLVGLFCFIYFKIFSLLFLLSFLFLMMLYLLSFFVSLKNKTFYKKLISTYKWGALSAFVLFFSFFSLANFVSFSLMQETRLWLMKSPLFIIDIKSISFFSFAMLVSWSIMNFGVDYMSDEKGAMGFLSLLILFLFFMFFLVFSGSFVVLFIGWEGVGLLSFLLISWWGSRTDAVSSSLQAVVYNRVGDASLLLFLVFYLMYSNSLYLGDSMILSILFIFFLFSVLAKSAQLSFHPWLPSAMESPTPVSSLLHSSTMVVASVYLLMRCMSMFSVSFIVFLIGLFTCVLSSAFGFSQYDFKKVVAYSTTSQLGFMMMMLSLGFVNYCMFYMMAHAFFKALIFMMSGVVIHMTSSAQDFRGMNSMILMNKLMGLLYIISAMSMMGLPFLSGFWIKDLVLEETNFSFMSITFYFFFLIAVLMTSLYSLRLYFGMFDFYVFKQKKLMVGVSLKSYYSFLRLFLGSVLTGCFFFFFYGPVSHILMSATTKVFSILILMISVLASLVAIKQKGFGFYSLSYLLYYNPMNHKLFSKLMMKYGEMSNLLDFLLMEYLFNGSIFFVRSTLSSNRLLIFLFVFFLLLSL